MWTQTKFLLKLLNLVTTLRKNHLANQDATPICMEAGNLIQT